MMLDLDAIFPLALPSLEQFDRCTDNHLDVIGVSRSAWGRTGMSTSPPPHSRFSTRLWDWDGQLFRFNLSLVVMDDVNASLWKAVFRRLRDQRGTFYFSDPHRKTALGPVTGTPRVNGANQTMDSLIIDGATNNLTPWIRAGDYFQLERNYYMCTQDADSDGSGNVTIKHWPELRQSPADNAYLTVINARGVFRLADNPEFEVMPIIYDGVEFMIVEEPQ